MIENKAPGKDISDEDLASKFPLAARRGDEPRRQFEVAGVPFGGDLIPVMAGPNTVENREMILRTAEAVKKAGGHFLRGGACAKKVCAICRMPVTPPACRSSPK